MTGPESCGKTTLATRLSATLRLPLVPEVSREYLSQKLSADGHFNYSETELLEIASEQNSLELRAVDMDPGLLLCDTDLLVIIIWSEVRFGHCHQWILDTFADRLGANKRHYLLCDYDVPWQPDPLRENADGRGELFELYRQKLEFYQLPYTVMSGDIPTRLDAAMAVLDSKAVSH